MILPVWPREGAGPDPLAHPDYYRGVPLRRAIAYGIDLVIIAIITGLLAFPFFLVGILSFGLLKIPLALAWSLIPLAYHTFLIGGPRSATLGMRLFDLEVRGVEGQRPDRLQALIMTVLFYLSVPPTGGLVLAVVFFNDRRRTLHDFLAGTVVVNSPSVMVLRPGA